MMDQPRMVKLAELWERTSARGTRYFSGFIGDCQVLLFDGGEKDHPTRPGERVHVWRLMVQERDPSRRPAQQSTRQPSGYRGDSARRAPTDEERARAAAREATREPPASWVDDSEAAIRDLTGRGR